MPFPMQQAGMNPLLMQLLMNSAMTGQGAAMGQGPSPTQMGPQIPQVQRPAASGPGAPPIMAQPPSPPSGLLAQMTGNGTGTGGSLGALQGLLAPKAAGTAPATGASGASPPQAAPNFPIPMQPQQLAQQLGPMNFAQQPSNWMQRLFGSNFNGFNHGAQ